MHYQMLITLAVAPEATSEEVRQQAYDTLAADDSFCGSGGSFGYPLSDWFVIGGRWSGMLAEAMIGDVHKDAIVARFPEMAKGFWPQSLIEQHGTELDTLWAEHGGNGPSPHTRSGYEELGFSDDAMLLSQELYDFLLSEHEGESIVRDGCGCEFADLDGECLEPDFIGRKWLVVVDYHC